MYRNLNEKEISWINKLLAVDFKGKKILENQILKAKVCYQQEYSFISLKFMLDDTIQTYPYSVRVPIEMYAFQKESVPIVFLIHVIKGVIDELEIFPADSSKINIDNIEIEDVEYEIDDAVKL